MTGVWVTADTITAARMNEKTIIQASGGTINGLTTYAGMVAVCTSTGSGFTADHIYVRNVANSAWTDFTPSIIESSESSTTPISDNAEAGTLNQAVYAFFTLPTTYKWYKITGIEWKNGTAVAGNITGGVEVVGADPPTNTNSILVALSTAVAGSGTSAVQRNSTFVYNTAISGGSICGAWINSNNGSHLFRRQTGLGSQNQQKAITYSTEPVIQNTTAWTADTIRYYIKVYYVGYTGYVV